jgi:hypothetical protein
MLKRNVLNHFLFFVAVSICTISLCLWSITSGQAASPASKTNVEPEFNIDKEVERLIEKHDNPTRPPPATIDPKNMKFPVDVRYTGKCGDGQYYYLHTWIVTDKATGARILVLKKDGSDGIACVQLPQIK